MTTRHTTLSFTSGSAAALFAIAGLAGPCAPLFAQDQPANPPAAEKTPAAATDSKPTTPPADPAVPAPATPATTPVEVKPAAPVVPAEPKPRAGPLNRRVLDGPATTLGFKNVAVEQLVPFIVEATGKVVLPQQDVLTRKITIFNDEPVSREHALDLIILALQQIGVAVIESQETIFLRDINDIPKQDLPVVGPDESTLTRNDLGSIIQKIFRLSNSTAENVATVLKDSIPDYAKLLPDKESNTIIVLGPVSLAQRIERIINALDQPSAASLQSETFHLKYADPDTVAQLVKDLFSASANNNNRGGNNQQQNPFQFFRPGGPGGQQGGQQGQQGRANNPSSGSRTSAVTGTDDNILSANIRASSNKQQNSVTVVAERPVLEQVRKLIMDEWDKPIPEITSSSKIYELKNSDPVKIQAILESMFGKASGTGSTTTGNAGGGNFGAQGASSSSSANTAGVGPLAGQFSFQAVPDSGRLVVISKSQGNLSKIDKIIEDLDRPMTAGLPAIVELKHANSEELAEQLNTLLAQDGTLAQIARSASGLSSASSNASPFSSTSTTSTTTTDNGATNGNTTNANASTSNISFWWQRSRPPTDRRSASNLISNIRIVPVWRQNALLVLAPPEYRQSVVDLVDSLDKPGRQVLISAVVAEVSSEDALDWGLRWSSSTINPVNADNSFALTNKYTNSATNWIFDGSVLNASANVNLLLQALAQKSTISVLSEPKIFTSDNQEASFFDGQDVPFTTNSQVNSQGNLTQSFDYRAVGIQLRARPRITVNGLVDLSVNLQLSSIDQTQTINNSFVVDRRETTTQLLLQNGQTVVISGILRKERQDIVRKVPILADIPLLGYLFTSRDKTDTDTEILVFITPTVVVNPSDADQPSQPFKQRLDDLRKELQMDDTTVKKPASSTSADGV